MSFAKVPFIHIAFASGYDHLEKPDYIIGTDLETKWDTVVKTGRYGEGKCFRIDGPQFMIDNIVNDQFMVPSQCPGMFIHDAHMVQWSQNNWEDNPNGYNCVIPGTQRMHVYQKPGSAWVIDTFYMFYEEGAVGFYIALKDGQLRHYADQAAVAADDYAVLATIPNTVSEWYSLEFIQEPDSPVLPAEVPVFVGSGDPLVRVPITFKIVINGVVYYTYDAMSSGYDVVNIGYHMMVGTTEVFLDNYYYTFMTDVGVATLDNSTWVIRKDKPLMDSCRGQWTAFDEVTGVRSVDVDFSEYIEFTNRKSMINHTNRIISEDVYPYTCLDGNYTKFNYSVPTPAGAQAVWAFATTLERYSTSSDLGFRGVWVMQGNNGGWQERDFNWGLGTMDGLNDCQFNDPYESAGKEIYTSAFWQLVYNKFLPEPLASGSVNIGTEYKGAFFP